MKIVLDKNIFFDKLSIASRFISERINSPQLLQGVLIKGDKNEIDIYSSNLNNFFHTKIKIKIDKKINILIEPKKILEFLSFLPAGKIELEFMDKKLTISQLKTKGTFPLMFAEDFPLPPKTEENEQKIKTKTLKKNLSQILFSAARDEGRPALTGVNFLTNDDLTMVTTDGFRLSLIKTQKQTDHPPFIVPAEFLEEVVRLIKDEEEVVFIFSKEEKIVVFKIGDNELYSRLIEGEFPPFEKVIPDKHLTRAIINKEELVRAVKLIAVFARDSSNVVVLNFKNNELLIRPKTDGQENSTLLEIKSEGEEQKVAFNYRFLLDFLNHSSEEEKNIVVELLRSDAPVVFRTEKQPNYLHIIMPVRIQED